MIERNEKPFLERTANRLKLPGLIGGPILYIAGLTVAGIFAFAIGGGSYFYEKHLDKKRRQRK